jgi:aminoglycoside 6'-N-acetyltransferase I
MIRIRPATAADRPQLAQARAALWPSATLEQHDAELARIFRGEPVTTLPLQILVAEEDGRIVGFCEVDLRSHADGCDPQRPVAYLEGWYVSPDHRRLGVGRALVGAAEEWGRSHGCTEIASDTWLDHQVSQHAHEALGFTVVDRCVHYRKALS